MYVTFGCEACAANAMFHYVEHSVVQQHSLHVVRMDINSSACITSNILTTIGFRDGSSLLGIVDSRRKELYSHSVVIPCHFPLTRI